MLVFVFLLPFDYLNFLNVDLGLDHLHYEPLEVNFKSDERSLSLKVVFGEETVSVTIKTFQNLVEIITNSPERDGIVVVY